MSSVTIIEACLTPLWRIAHFAPLAWFCLQTSKMSDAPTGAILDHFVGRGRSRAVWICRTCASRAQTSNVGHFLPTLISRDLPRSPEMLLIILHPPARTLWKKMYVRLIVVSRLSSVLFITSWYWESPETSRRSRLALGEAASASPA